MVLWLQLVELVYSMLVLAPVLYLSQLWLVLVYRLCRRLRR